MKALGKMLTDDRQQTTDKGPSQYLTLSSGELKTTKIEDLKRI